MSERLIPLEVIYLFFVLKTFVKLRAKGKYILSDLDMISDRVTTGAVIGGKSLIEVKEIDSSVSEEDSEISSDAAAEESEEVSAAVVSSLEVASSASAALSSVTCPKQPIIARFRDDASN